MEAKNQIQMPRVKLGSQGLEVSKLGFGCAGLSGIYNAPLAHEEGCSIINEAFSRGITFFDTADVYGMNDNEIMVGKLVSDSVAEDLAKHFKYGIISNLESGVTQALKQLPREKVQLATKFGVMLGGGQAGIKGTPEYVRQCCEASLKRLDVDYIDLYYQHRVDTSVPIEDTMGELKRLVEEGKIKYIGLSEANIDTIRRAHAIHPITAIQMEYSLMTREIEDEIIPVCRELGIGIVAYSPLGRGFLGGKAVVETIPSESQLPSIPRYSGDNLEKNKLLYARLAELAARHACTISQLALAWLLHRGNDIVPIPGTTKLKNLDNNIGSLALKLTTEDLQSIAEAVPVSEVAGERSGNNFTKYNWEFATTPPKI